MRRRARAMLLAAAGLLALPAALRAQHLLVPMDDEQQDHLRAYGLAFQVLTDGGKAEWLLNYRGGAFLLPDAEAVRRAVDGGEVQFPFHAGRWARP